MQLQSDNILPPTTTLQLPRQSALPHTLVDKEGGDENSYEEEQLQNSKSFVDKEEEDEDKEEGEEDRRRKREMRTSKMRAMNKMRNKDTRERKLPQNQTVLVGQSLKNPQKIKSLQRSDYS